MQWRHSRNKQLLGQSGRPCSVANQARSPVPTPYPPCLTWKLSSAASSRASACLWSCPFLSPASASSSRGSPHSGHLHFRLRAASFCLSGSPYSRLAIAPWAGVGRKPMMAIRAVRIDQLGRHDSGWWPEMDRQIFLLVSNRPFGCRGERGGVLTVGERNRHRVMLFL